jgi:DNA-binding beta-propeller fold protein YncE
MVTFGSGSHRYQPVDRFFKRPRKTPFVEVADVAVDADDNVYVFNRGPYGAVMIFDRDGNYLDAWGRIGADFSVPHGITIAPNGDVLTADTDDHTARRWTKEGKLLMTIGRANRNSPEQSGEPFNRPTHLAVASNDDLYASDGYGNSHIHCFDPYGKLKFSWGGHGSGQGQFDTIHSVFVDHQDGDKIYAADRYNSRVQYFTKEGQFLGEWTGLNLANSVRKGPDGTFAVAELDHRVSVLNAQGEILARWGDTGVELDNSTTGSGLPTSPSRNPMLVGKVLNEPGAGLHVAPHGIAVDSQGSIYVADVGESFAQVDRGNRAIQKFIKVS